MCCVEDTFLEPASGEKRKIVCCVGSAVRQGCTVFRVAGFSGLQGFQGFRVAGLQGFQGCRVAGLQGFQGLPGSPASLPSSHPATVRLFAAVYCSSALTFRSGSHGPPHACALRATEYRRQRGWDACAGAPAARSHAAPRSPTPPHAVPRSPTQFHAVPHRPTQSHTVPRRPTIHCAILTSRV